MFEELKNGVGPRETNKDASLIRWRKGELIGCSALGHVYVGMNLDSGELLVVKQVLLGTSNVSKEKAHAHIREFEEEVKLLKNLSHLNIVTSSLLLIFILGEMEEVFLLFFQTKWEARCYKLEGWPTERSCLNSDDQKLLEAKLTFEEVEGILEQLGGNTALGNDGVTNSFIKAYWGIIKTDFWKAIKHFSVNGEFNEEWKETFIVLIPKVSNPILPSNYRPISLCNKVYKVAAKIIQNRLAMVIPKLISMEQTTFIKRRSLLDNVLVAQEIFHKLRISKNYNGLVSFKVDMEQAYDSMVWSSLRNVLVYFNFPSKISKLILACVEDPKFALIINGNLSNWIHARSDFRQDSFEKIKYEDYQFIIENALKKLNQWASKLQSLAGHENNKLANLCANYALFDSFSWDDLSLNKVPPSFFNTLKEESSL
ncbi:hypothetical protein KFK09_004878 [Dendrobium nobile]|uniref:Reverse transcriptase domain-containing protein n=1 Tax=Dendrobium nobile TaxID=94219 RepID=A0A8T3BZ66_DENNO|nr:hypothetical protein KFK09_004878 [Dendrobium nobile]